MQQLIRDIEAMPEGEEWVFDQLADGQTVAQVAETLGVSRRYLYMWRDRQGHKERLKPIWEAAIRMSAEADLEKSTHEFARLDRVIDVTENGEPIHRVPLSSEVQLMTGRAKFRQWYAGKKDPERFGEKDASINLNFNVGDLHVDAVQAAKERHRIAPAASNEEGTDGEEDEGLLGLMGG